MSIEKVTCQVGAQEIEFEVGRMGKLADGAVTVRVGDTIVMVTAVSQTSIREGQDWFPLSVEYKEKAAAAGRFPGGYFKREGRPTEKEILTCRMTDRPLRPLFPKGYFYDTQVISLLLSADMVNDADIPSMNGASAALCVSDIPFAGPIAAVRVGLVNGEFVANPTFEQREESTLDLVYAGLRDKVIMIEGAGNEVPDAKFKEALAFAQDSIQPLIDAQEELMRRCGKEKRESDLLLVKDEILDIAYQVAGDRIEEALMIKQKVARGKAVGALRDEVEAAVIEKFEDAGSFEINQAFDYMQKKSVRLSLLNEGKRMDGRGENDIRDLSAETSVMPRTHGSSLFARGETQALALATLAPGDEVQYLDNYAGGEDTKRFILHYNFPPFSVGECGRMGGMNRREIGHGALAERSIEPVIPDLAEFPYAIRVTSEVMESNGSTSMASVCSGSLALLDAGVPIKANVAGISCGLVTELDDAGNIQKHVTILDIIGSEDFFGDMDFKLCGTREGVTGYQLDLKLPGIPLDILNEGVDKAMNGRMKVLDVMDGVIKNASELSEYAPRIESFQIDPSKIGELIGPGGKNIKGIQSETGADISIDDDGTVNIYAANGEGLQRAIELVKRVTAEIEIGVIYHGKIVNTTNFGAFIEVLPGKDGMIHISELADFRVKEVEDVVKVGDMVYAKCIGIDEKGRVKMSRKAAMEERGEEAEKELAEG
ncbi:MAG: polyribonucleotide nucleotidyltransferase [Verrucomicrobiales bacterium]|nr:polyribonucleotide nucleotidyltransferase [Verrucomicrobiales bacterium]